MNRIWAMNLALTLLLLTGCEAAPATSEPEGPGAKEPSPVSFFARASCDPLAALLKLRDAYPEARFYLEKVENGVVGTGKATELKFTNPEELEAGVRAPQGSLVWVKCLLDGREVGVTVTHGHIDVKAGPYMWSARGKARESAEEFVAGAKRLFTQAGVVNPVWHINLKPLSAAAAGELCARLGASDLDLFAVTSAGRMVPKGKISHDTLAKVERPAVVQFRFPMALLDLQFVEMDDEVFASIEAGNPATFVDLANKAEPPK